MSFDLNDIIKMGEKAKEKERRERERDRIKEAFTDKNHYVK